MTKENKLNVETLLGDLVSESKTKRAKGSSITAGNDQSIDRSVHITTAYTLARNKKQSNKLRRYLVKKGYAVNDSGKSWRAIERFVNDEETFGTVVITCQKESNSKRRQIAVYKETVMKSS